MGFDCISSPSCLSFYFKLFSFDSNCGFTRTITFVPTDDQIKSLFESFFLLWLYDWIWDLIVLSFVRTRTVSVAKKVGLQ